MEHLPHDTAKAIANAVRSEMNAGTLDPRTESGDSTSIIVCPATGKFVVQVSRQGVRYYLGRYDDLQTATTVRDEFWDRYHRALGLKQAVKSGRRPKKPPMRLDEAYKLSRQLTALGAYEKYGALGPALQKLGMTRNDHRAMTNLLENAE